jgi:hypothetical protein
MSEDLTEKEKELICKWLDKFGDDYVKHLSKLSKFKEEHNLNPKPKLELNRWIVCDGDQYWMIYLEGEDTYYGFNCGDWMYKPNCVNSNQEALFTYNKDSSYRYATDEEIKTALTKEAIKRGYDKKQSECLFGQSTFLDFKDVNFTFDMYFNELWITCGEDANHIFEKGKWADFKNTEIEDLEQKYKELGKEIEKLKNK